MAAVQTHATKRHRPSLLNVQEPMELTMHTLQGILQLHFQFKKVWF
jgi:hypothetical protein